MAYSKQFNFDFNCPQYVDFLTGIEDKYQDISIDCENSPLDKKASKIESDQENVLTEAAENQLIDKMTAALSIIENTPKLKVGTIRGKLFSETASFKNVASQQMKSLVKLNSRSTHKSYAAVHSKSVCVLDLDHIYQKNKVKELKPKRSSSLNDLRTVKKYTYPKTPLCLKRTIKAKAKGALKTTEEIELEQIAQLQKELTQLLRNNEISYRRLKLKQKSTVQKSVECKPENPKVTSSTCAVKNERQNFHALSHVAMKKKVQKLNSIINKDVSGKDVKSLSKDILEKSKNPSVSSSIILEECDKSKTTVSKKPVKYGFHSGLVLCNKPKESTVIKPINFDAKTKKVKSQNAEPDEKSRAKSVSDMSYGKENIPVIKPVPFLKKIMDAQNIKIDPKQLALDKRIVRQRHGNAMRSLALSENSKRC